MSGVDKQKKYFELLNDIIDTPIYTTRNWRKGNDFKPGKQYKIGGVEPPIDHRTVGSNEVVIDLDAATYSQNKKYSDTITNYLDSISIPYYTFWSGNKSVHIHVFLDLEISSPDVLELIDKAIDLGVDVEQEIRMKLAKQIVEQSGLPARLIGKVVDIGKLKWNAMAGRSTLIRCCGGANSRINRDGDMVTGWKTWYQEMPKSKPKPLGFDEVEYPTAIRQHNVGETFIAEAVSDYIKALTPHKKKELQAIDYTGEFLSMDCVQKVRENGLPVGQRNIGAKALAVACRLDKLEIEKAKEVLREYISNCPKMPEPYTESEAFHWLEWIYKQRKVYWSPMLITIGVCDPHTCPYYGEKYKEEIAVFDVDDPLAAVKEALDYCVVGEDALKMTLFLLYITKEFSPEWCIMLDGDAASGKSHVMKSVANLFGDENEEYFVFSRITKASLNYLEELAPLLQKKVVIIEELQGASDVVEQLRVAISEGKLSLLSTEEVKVEGVTKRVSQIKVIDLSHVLFVTCNAEEYDEGEQLKSRAWILNTDISSEQTKAIMEYSLAEFSAKKLGGIPRLEEIRAGLKFLKRPDKVVFPFAKDLLPYLHSSSVRGRRDVKKMISLVKAHAFVSQKRRSWYVDENGQDVLIADWRDVKNSYIYAGESLNASTQGIGAKDLQYYDKIVNGAGSHISGFTIEEVEKWCDLKKKTAQNTMCRLSSAGFFENKSMPGTPAWYERTDSVPHHLGDLVGYSDVLISTQGVLISEWVSQNANKTKKDHPKPSQKEAFIDDKMENPL
jgi:hypothetical protein|tara:strand:- start:1785 stop:4136 length:2352 start_codon:yes stop_codon:yes gene_type:complete